MSFGDCFKNKTVFVTGHTGFKGSWLCEWLLHLGAKVVGYALEPPTVPSLYQLSDLSKRLQRDIRNDINDAASLAKAIQEAAPDFVFHLAAQPIVRLSFSKPRETFATNIFGTYNVLEALRGMKKACVAILITTDKVYENREWTHAYRETDPLGGHDPYSASKACAELIISSCYRSFFRPGLLSGIGPAIAVASVRAGNVIGGGDRAPDRIVPDCIRYLEQNRPIPVRNKSSTRPWQHVLEPLAGYLTLAAAIKNELDAGTRSEQRLDMLCSPFNFGPNPDANRTVLELVNEIFKHWPGTWEEKLEPNAPHEAGILNLASGKAFATLAWQPRWGFEKTIEETVGWYREAAAHIDDCNYIEQLTKRQIEEYSKTM
jgi:CDP-glucose 4,6-dehydratase